LPNIRKKSYERLLSIDELRALLPQASHREHLVLRILAVRGLRPAEILVLRIEDFEGTQLRIDEALKERQKGEDRIGETMMAESDNYVPVTLCTGSGKEISRSESRFPSKRSIGDIGCIFQCDDPRS
jgi:hypothetical protein